MEAKDIIERLYYNKENIKINIEWFKKNFSFNEEESKDIITFLIKEKIIIELLENEYELSSTAEIIFDSSKDYVEQDRLNSYLIEFNIFLKKVKEWKEYFFVAEDKKRDIAEDLLLKQRNNATEKIVNIIKEKNNIYSTRNDDKSEIWIYREGVYIPQGKTYIQEMCRNILGKAITSQLCNEVILKIETDTYINQETFFNSSQKYLYEIPVMNGILNIETKELLSFNKDKIFFNKLPVLYNPKMECPKIDKFLSEVLAKEEDKKIIYELGGFCLLKDYRYEKAFMFYGNGRNGKDKTLELLKRLFGIENCCSVPIHSIVPESFIISEFFGKMINLAGEIQSNDLKDTSEFKSLTGRSLKTAQRKFLTPVTFVNYAKFIFACNELPMVYDNSRGFWDRWILLNFPYSFVTEEEYNKTENKSFIKIKDDDIISKITTPEELSGLLNKFLEGYNTIKENKGFSNTLGCDEVKQVWIQKSNSVMAFCMQRIEENYESCISKKLFRHSYIEFCKKNKLNPKSDVIIKKTLLDMFGVNEGYKTMEVGGNQDYVWEGISFKK